MFSLCFTDNSLCSVVIKSSGFSDVGAVWDSLPLKGEGQQDYL